MYLQRAIPRPRQERRPKHASHPLAAATLTELVADVTRSWRGLAPTSSRYSSYFERARLRPTDGASTPTFRVSLSLAPLSSLRHPRTAIGTWVRTAAATLRFDQAQPAAAPDRTQRLGPPRARLHEPLADDRLAQARGFGDALPKPAAAVQLSDAKPAKRFDDCGGRSNLRR